MFTGLIQSLGKVNSIIEADQTNRQIFKLILDCQNLSGKPGDSIAVNGCCLTISNIRGTSFSFDLSKETLNHTNFRHIQANSLVNIEPALKVGDLLGGHLVSGHIDAVATLDSITESHEGHLLNLSFAQEFASYVVPKGSICLDGISLTINEINDSPATCSISCMIIPCTWAATNLKHAQPGQEIHVEFDMLGKYILRQSQINAIKSL